MSLYHVEPCESCAARERVHRAAGHTGYAIAAAQLARIVEREGLVDALAAACNYRERRRWADDRETHERLRALKLVIEPWGKSWASDGRYVRRATAVYLGELVLSILRPASEDT